MLIMLLNKNTPNQNWITAIDGDEEYVLAPKIINDEEHILTDQEAEELVVLRREGKQFLQEYEANAYARDRASSYPTVANQLDMLWHMMENETIPGKGSTWYNAIQAVKDQFPKP